MFKTTNLQTKGLTNIGVVPNTDSPFLRRDSFERFGDDLTQVLLRYLSFKDIFRFECLSKQIQRLVFNSITDLKVYNKCCLWFDSVLMSDKTLKIKTLESVLKKCQNIKTLEMLRFTDSEKEINLFIKYCHHLNEIKLDFDELNHQLIEQFFDKFGPKLKKIHFKTNNELMVKNILKVCPNVEEFDGIMIDFEDLFDGNELLVKNLKSFRFYYSDSDIERIESIVNQNKNSLQSIETFLAEEVNEKQFNEYFDVILKLTEIKRLKAYFASDCICLLLEQLITNLSQKCNKLTKIEIDMSFDEFNDILKIFNSFNRFTKLKVLKFSNFSRKVSQGELSQPSALPLQSLPCSFIKQSLINCNELMELSIDGNIFSFGEPFFESLVKHSPKLQSIWCSNVEITDNTLNSLSHLCDLSSISLLTNCEKNITNESIVKLIRNNTKLKSIALSFNAIRCELRDTDIEFVRQNNHLNSFDYIFS